MTELKIQTYVLGPLENNTYLLSDPVSLQAVIVDPSLGSETLLPELERQHLHLTQIWLTHAHFDHTTGIKGIYRSLGTVIPIGIHPDDLPLYQDGGGAKNFGIRSDPGPEPTFYFQHGEMLTIGDQPVEVRHVPGHTRGHVLFYSPSSAAALVGDVIFAGSVGRTDLPGGSHARLIESIRTQILTLPAATRLLSGHGPETNVERESKHNPFLR